MVRRTLKTAGMPVGQGYLGRVVDALGLPVDGKGAIEPEGYRPMETPALTEAMSLSTLSTSPISSGAGEGSQCSTVPGPDGGRPCP